MASAPATGSAATKEAIKRVLVVIGKRHEGRNSREKKQRGPDIEPTAGDG